MGGAAETKKKANSVRPRHTNNNSHNSDRNRLKLANYRLAFEKIQKVDRTLNQLSHNDSSTPSSPPPSSPPSPSSPETGGGGGGGGGGALLSTMDQLSTYQFMATAGLGLLRNRRMLKEKEEERKRRRRTGRLGHQRWPRGAVGDDAMAGRRASESMQ